MLFFIYHKTSYLKGLPVLYVTHMDEHTNSTRIHHWLPLGLEQVIPLL